MKRNALVAAIGSALGMCGAQGVAAADTAKRLELIEVVGSRIKRVDIETSQPVFIVEREDIERTGLVSVGDVLQQLTVHGAAVNALVNNGNDGATRVDLRNLGDNRTLVLVNGRRWTTSIFGSVDLSTIPLAIVERIEVLKDGASAIYGSDAIAGVINITTRDRYDGAGARSSVGEYEQGDGRSQAYGFTIGSSTERASVVADLSYVKQEPVFAGDRTISAVPTFGLPATNVNAGASPNTRQGQYNIAGTATMFVLDFGQAGCISGVRCPASTRSQFVLFDPNIHGFNFAPENYVVTPAERVALYVQARWAVTDAIAFRTEVLYNERRSEQYLAPNPQSFLGAGMTIRADHVYNPFGVAVTRVALRLPERFPRRYSQDNDLYRFVAVFDGMLHLGDRSFTWDAGFVYSDNEQLQARTGVLDAVKLGFALGPTFIDADGVPRCGVPGNALVGCVPLNLFGGAEQITDEQLDYVAVVRNELFYYELHDYAANVTGDLLDLPVGPMAFAAGYEYRRQFGAGVLNPQTPTTSAAGGYTQNDAYIELNVPLLASSSAVGLLELNAAVRRSDYSLFGATTNPKAGFRWSPHRDLLVRGNWSRGFRAPVVAELFSGAFVSFQGVVDPCSATSNPTGAVADRCAAAGVVVGNYQQNSSQIRLTIGGNPDLRPERAVSRTLGFVWSPTMLDGLDVYLDWYDIGIADPIDVPSGQSVFDDCYVNGVEAVCAAITRGPGGFVRDVFAQRLNLPGGTEVEGYDLTIDYRFDTNIGRFAVRWDNAYTSYRGPVGNDDGANRVGVYVDREPAWRLRSNVAVSWSSGDWSAAASGRYYSGLDESCALPNRVANAVRDDSFRQLCTDPLERNDPQFGGDGINHQGSVTYVDVQASWDTPWNARVTLGVNNALDREPPVSYATFANSFDPQYEIPGRFWYATYTQRF